MSQTLTLNVVAPAVSFTAFGVTLTQTPLAVDRGLADYIVAVAAIEGVGITQGSVAGSSNSSVIDGGTP